MLRGEHRRGKVYGSRFGVLKKLAICSFLFRGFKDIKRYADVFKCRKQEISYREVKKEEDNFQSQIPSLRCNELYIRDVRLIYLKI